MQIEEIVRVQVTFANPKERQALMWNLSKPGPLHDAIKECLNTGKEVFAYSKGETVLYHVRPEFPLIPEAMAKPENQSLLKVSVSVFSQAFSLGVRP